METPEEFEKRMEEEPRKPADEFEKHYELESPKPAELPVTGAEQEEREMVSAAAYHEGPGEEEYLLDEKTMEPSIGDRLARFAGKAAKIAGGAVVAPVALAAMGATAAYEAITKKEGEPLVVVAEGRMVPEIEYKRDSEERTAPGHLSITEGELEKGIESPKAAEASVTAAERGEFPLITETVTTVSRYEMESPEDFEKRMEEKAGKSLESPEDASAERAELLEDHHEALTTVKESHVAYESEERAAPLSGGKGTELPEDHHEALTTAKEWETTYESEERFHDPSIKYVREYVIESEEYKTESQEQPQSSPRESEEALLEKKELPEGHHEAIAPLAEDKEQFVLESEEYEAKSPEQPLSSPTKTEEVSFQEKQLPEDHREVLATVKDWDAAYEVVEETAPLAEDKEQFVIESEEYEAKSPEQPLSSPTKTEEVSFQEKQLPEDHREVLATEYEAKSPEHPLSSPTKTEETSFEEKELPELHETLTTTKDWETTYEIGEGFHDLSTKDARQYIIESKEYETESQEQPLSSPSEIKEAAFEGKELSEDHHECLSTVQEHELSLQESRVIGSSPLSEKRYYIEDPRLHGAGEAADMARDQLPERISSQKDEDSQLFESVQQDQTSIQMLDEKALENVVKVTFRDTAELDSPEKQSTQAPSSYPDEQLSIAGDEEWKVYDNKGEVLEEFSHQLTQELILEAECNASVQSLHSPSMVTRQDSYNDISLEHEIDYQSDLQEKLDILAGESREKLTSVHEEDQLEVINETEYEHESEDEHDIEKTASRLAEDAINAALEPHEDAKTLTSTSESNVYHTATEQSKDDQYDTCVTSQDTYDSAQEWTSQESEYTTAASGATSRLSEAEERHGSVTPLAILSPVDSDRQFTANQDFDDVVPIRRFGIDDTARSTPDVALQVTIEEEEEESEATLATSPSGVLLAPQMDPGRPISPVPPTRQVEEDEEIFVFLEKPVDKDGIKALSDGKKADESSAEAEASGESQGEKTYTRQYSDMSSESHADTVIHHEKGDTETVVDAEEIRSSCEPMSGSSDSLDKTSARSSTVEKRDTSSQRSSASPPKESEGVLDTEQPTESPSSEDSLKEKASDSEEGFVICSFTEDTPIVEGELETVEEEPEDVESVNGSGNSSVGAPSDSLALLGKYKHVSSDNVSLTSLQEFERLEQVVINRGEASLSASEIELYAAGKLRSGEGSVSSLAEFEKLEKELAANISPQEDAAMLPEIREESEVEDMSVRDDDEDDHSETEVKTRPIDEEDLRAATPIASPVDSLEREPVPPSAVPLLETSTDSLEPSYERIESQAQRDSDTSSLAEYEVITRLGESARDSLENIHHERDSLLEGASQDIMTSQDTHALLSGDTVGTYQEHDDDDKDSLGGDMDTMLRDYPTTLTTFETTAIGPDFGTVQTISRRVETRVGTYQEHDDDDKDSLGGDMDTMLRDYPTTLTTFETTAIGPDGTVQTISRRVETRV
ncbi:hypothetical protein OSTOST_09445 [Ostertagia ostertagi]